MSKIFVTVVVFLMSLPVILANICDPTPFIRELYFEDNGDYLMEVYFMESLEFYQELDYTLEVKSLSGIFSASLISDAAQFNVHPGASDFSLFFSNVVASELVSDQINQIPLVINKDYDSLTVSSIEFGFSEPLCLGNHPDSQTGSLDNGQSIVLVDIYDSVVMYRNKFYCKDLSPFDGERGTKGTYKGILYDMNNNPIKNDRFKFLKIASEDFIFETDAEGQFEYNVFATRCQGDWIYYIGQSYPANHIATEAFDFMVQPDSVLVLDIHLTEATSSINDDQTIIAKEVNLFNSPNPFNPSTTIFYDIPANITFSHGYLKIYDVKGSLVQDIKISNNHNGSIKWDGRNSRGLTTAAGLYLYHIVLDGDVYGAGEMIMLK